MLRVLGLVFAVAAIPAGGIMVGRRLRLVAAGDIVHGTITGISAARAGGAIVYSLAVEVTEPPLGIRLVRAYREFEVDDRIRIRTHPAEGDRAWLAEWSHLGYELMIGALVVIAGILAGFAVLVAG